jgi:hypothetical protein
LKVKLASLFCILTVASMAATQSSAAQEVQNTNSPAVDKSDGLSRAEMAVEMLRAGGVGFTPPACVAGSTMFADVPSTNPFCPWIEELARRGITAGCGGGNYCPLSPVDRGQMAVFQVGTLSAGGTARALITRSATARPELRIGTWTVNRPAAAPTGVYCLTVAGVNPTTAAAIVTVEWGASSGFDLLAYWYKGAGTCAVGQFEVRTYDFAAGGAPVLSNDVEFLVVIP